MSARDGILLRIRQTRRTDRASDGVVQSRLHARMRGPLPSLDTDLPVRFRDRATTLASDVRGPIAANEAPAAVAAYLAEKQLPLQAVCWPRLAALAWARANLAVQARGATADDLVGITGAFCAIAETGTLMLLSGPETPATVSLLPETHIALLPLARIVARMEDGWDWLRREHGTLPRAVNFISGPSRTADIEQTVTLGAHGPYRVCIVLVSDEL
jgi:L-lactate dehydrogenase complex protein LldG